MSNNNSTTNKNNNRDRTDSWLAGAAIGVAGALVGGAIYLMNRPKTQVEPQPQPSSSATPVSRTQINQSLPGNNSNNPPVSSYLADMFDRLCTSRGTTFTSKSSVRIQEIESNETAPENPTITNLNSLLADIHVRYIKLKQFNLHYKVFDRIFQDLHKKMKKVDPYYQKYSSTVQFAGSHFDNLRIKKPDEFDMDIVIGLPLNLRADPNNLAVSDITIESQSAGFLQLRMGVQFQKLPERDKEEWLINKTAFRWKDESNYLLRSKFTAWFKSVVNKALNEYDVSSDGLPICYVEGVPYVIDKSESGPAMTLLISNNYNNFKMDVDLVPCLKFPEDRWPVGKTYRNIPQECKKGYWMVVGKPNKSSPILLDQARSWRIALHNQERELMHNSYNLRQAVRLIKKLRDSLDMTKIASYYIKTLFFWQIIAINNPSYWQKSSPATLFKLMVGKLHEALVAGKILYFWNKNNNLIGNVDRNILNKYVLNLVPLMDILEQPEKYKFVAKYLLTPQEFAEYNAKFLHI